MIRLLNM